jgi:hypothetical protein
VRWPSFTLFLIRPFTLNTTQWAEGDLISDGTLQDECQWNSVAHIGQGSQNLPTSYKSTLSAVSGATRGTAFRRPGSLSRRAMPALAGENVSSVKHRKSQLANHLFRTRCLRLRMSYPKGHFNLNYKL